MTDKRKSRFSVPCLRCDQSEADTYCYICGIDICRSCLIDHYHPEYELPGASDD